MNSVREERFHKSVASSERGATLLEMTIALTAFIFFLGVVFDIGIGVYHYSLLTHAVNRAGRQTATALADYTRSNNCTTLETDAENLTTDYLRDSLKVKDVDNINITTTFLEPGDQCKGNMTSMPMMRISADWKSPCLLLCNILPNGIGIEVSTETVIENTQLTPITGTTTRACVGYVPGECPDDG